MCAIGPNVAPAVVAGGLVLLGGWLLYEALSGGWRDAVADNAAARGEHDFYAAAFIGLASRLFAQMLLIHRAGFVLAQAALFTCVARGFGSRKLLRDFAIGLVLGLAVFGFFVKFLNVNLPAGWLWHPFLAALESRSPSQRSSPRYLNIASASDWHD